MSIEFLIINPRLVPFFIMFFIGAILLGMAPIRYRWRTRTTKIALTPKDLKKYSSLEKKALYLGIMFAVLGILGAAFMSEEYGYNRIVYDTKGDKKIESSKPEPPPGVSNSHW